MVEELLTEDAGVIHKDFKFYIFHGQCQLIHVDFDRFANRSRSLFDRDWHILPVSLKFPQGPTMNPPKMFHRMRDLAERLGSGFDFVRIDLYSVHDRVYFGEFTHYPGSGLEKFSPQSFDFELGQYWQIRT